MANEVRTNEEIRELYESGNVSEFNKEMAKKVPVKNGTVALGDILSALDEVMEE